MKKIRQITSKMNPNGKKKDASKNENVDNEEATDLQEEQSNAADEAAGSDNVLGEVEALQRKYSELNDSHLRLMAKSDNYRKRTMRERADLIKTGGEDTLENLLPIIDDFERALQNVRAAEGVEAVKEGAGLILGKSMSYLSQQGAKSVETIGKPFDTKELEAIATIPVPEPSMKSKILDCIQTGYTLFDKAIRHAKVVVGE